MATNSQVVKTITIQLNTKDSKIKIDGITKGFVEAGEAAQNFNAKASQGFDALATGANNARSATGSASATVLEAGRVVSDFNYGIRGVANNLSQLANNFVFTAKKAGGFMEGLKDIGQAFMGPLGIILAINVAIAALERWDMSSRKASDANDDLSESLKQEMRILKLYEATLHDVNTSLEDRTAIVRGLSALDRDLAKKLKEAGNNQKDLAKVTSKYIEQKQIEVKIKQKEKELSEAIIKTDKSLDEQKNIVLVTIDDMNDSYDFQEKKLGALATQQDADNANLLTKENLQQNVNVATKEQNKVLDELLELYLKLNPEEEENAGNIRSFKEKYLDLSKVISAFNRRDEVASEKNELNKFIIKQRYEKLDLKLRLESFLKREKLRYDDFMASNANEEQKALATERYEKAKFDARKSYEQAYTDLVKTQSTERFNFVLEASKDYRKKYQEAIDAGEIQALSFEAGRDAGVDALETQQILLEEEYNQKVYWINEEIEERKRAGEAYMDLERQKRNATKEFNQESVILTDKAERTKRNIVALGFQAISKIAEDGSSINKAASAAAALMSTYEAANAALGAKPYGPWNKVEAAIVIAMGLSNVQKIFDTPTPGGRGGRGGQGGAGRTFDFNLVGSTGANQLAEAVGGQFQEPIQAYVVSNEMTSQQELDLQIQTGASLGD